MTRAILVLGVAISISFAAAWMSVVGMLAIFPGAGWLIVSTMIALESAKVISAEWLHSNWKSERVSRLHKGYLVIAVVALSLITNLGIYGYLAKGHLEAQAENAPIALEIAQKEERIKQLHGDLERYTEQQRQLSDTQNAFLRSKNDNRVGRDALRARQSMSAERNAVQTNIDTVNAEINKINQELVPLKVKTSAVDAKLGPIKFLGFKDPEVAVRVIMLLLMVAFDPLAIVLMISGTITLGEWAEGRRRKLAVPAASPVPEEPESKVSMEEALPEREPTIEPEPMDVAIPITEDMFEKWKNLTGDLEVNLEEEFTEEDMDEFSRIINGAVDPADVSDVKPPAEDAKERENLLKELEELNESKRKTFNEHVAPFGPPPSYSLGDFDVQATLHGEDAISIPPPPPSQWGHVFVPSIFNNTLDQERADAEEERETLPDAHEQFISLLESHPEFLEDVIQAVDETRAEAESQQGWLDSNSVKDRA